MSYIDVIVLVVEICVSILVVLLAPVLVVDLCGRICDTYRRKRHPEYFEYWDKAEKLAFERGAEYKKRKDYIDYQRKLYSDGLCEGECTEERYVNKMKELTENYIVLCNWFKDVESEIRELLIKADLYAKEHDCYWGIIYDTKRK